MDKKNARETGPSSSICDKDREISVGSQLRKEHDVAVKKF